MANNKQDVNNSDIVELLLYLPFKEEAQTALFKAPVRTAL